MNQERQWLLIQRLVKLFRGIPHFLAVRFGGFLGAVLWFLSKKRVDGAEARCVAALGVGPTLARRIVRESYINHGRSVAEFARLPIMKDSLSDMVTVLGEENLKSAFSAGKGVILLSAHLGNWEIGGIRIACMGYPLDAIGADQRDPRVTDLINSIRGEFSIKVIKKGFNLREALTSIKSGKLLVVLLDQDAREKGMVVPFLGLPASTAYGPLKMAAKTGAPLVPYFCVRRGKGSRFDCHILPPVILPRGRISDGEIMEYLKQCNDILSHWIKKHPGQWMWLYPRWASTSGDLLNVPVP